MRFIPTRVHGAPDYLVGILLLAAPWLFGFADYIRAPHVVLGAFEIGAALFTETVPSYGQTPRQAT